MRRQTGLLVLALFLALSGLLAAQQEPQIQVQQNRAPDSGLDHAQTPAEAGVKLHPTPVDLGERKGWKISFPGGRPLATPAWADGQIFLGGGFGSHEFYCLDAATGEPVWVYKTADDGPTAAVHQDGRIAFNTESCELEILDVKGKRLWKKWLGDPLMSMPAIHDGRVLMAFPDSRGDRRHYLGCFALDSGKELWRRPIAGEIITAPVVSGGQVYLSTLEGVVYAFDLKSGKELWSAKNNATSSPALWRDRVYYSQRKEDRPQAGEVRQSEQLTSLDQATRAESEIPATRRRADYLDYKRKQTSTREAQNQAHDATVGFGGSKGDSKMGQAQGNLGEGSVYGVWSYQGGRPFFHDGRMYSSMGDELTCVDAASGKVLWKRKFNPGPEGVDRTLAPPALVNGRIFVATLYGEVACLDAKSGEPLWSVRAKEAFAFQPVVARGRVYLPTESGSLYCLETGDPADDGWYMWGADAEHTGAVREP